MVVLQLNKDLGMNNRAYVLITGASSGIGKVIAVSLSEKYNVIIHGRNKERLQETFTQCNSDGEHHIWVNDLSKVGDVEEDLKSFLLNSNLVVSHFVHCAGFMKMLPLKRVNVENLQMTFNTNVFSATLITKVLMQKKLNNGALKSVVFISSNISNMGAKAFNVYAASKGALDSMMRCLATELAPNVRVNSVLPGAVQTEMTDKIFENSEVAQRMASTYPLGLGYPTDIYHAVEFLLSDNARWITGQQITVDGGRTINITG